MTALSVNQLTIAYGKQLVLWDLDLEVPAGKMVAIAGPNGAGKSTLLKAAIQSIPKASGEVKIFGSSYRKVRKRVGYVPQRESVDWDFPITVFEVVMMGRYGRLLRWPSKEDRQIAFDALQQVGMSGCHDRHISELSGGQQQRVFLARALAQEADLYLLDEPLAGVDATTEREIIEILQRLRDQGKTIVVVHHDLATLGSYFDHLILLNMRLVAAGPTESVLTQENLQRAYGKGALLFEEATRLR